MRRIRAMLFFALATLIAQQAAAQQACPTLIVTTNDDTVNGNTSSPCALIANPGPDGISLREAVMAANNATGSGAITITFAAALAGKTIAPSSSNGCCYIIGRDNVAIVGLTDANGAPTVTVDATNMFILFSVTASDFTLASMNIIGIGATSPGGSGKTAVYVRAGDNPGELNVSNTVIKGNIFSNTAGQAAGNPVIVGGAFPGAPNAVFSNAVITNNTFTNITAPGGTDAVKLQVDGTNSTVQNVSILNNTFTNVQYGIELVPADLSRSSRILNTDIAGNTFSGNPQLDVQSAVLIDPSGDDGKPSMDNTIDGTIIERNVVTGFAGPAISIVGGIGNGNTVSAIGNAITNTTILNNLVTGDTIYGGISIQGGAQESSGNSISGVNIVNNTIANFSGVNGNGGAIAVAANLSGGTNNTVSGVAVLNTILWNNTPADFTGVAPSQVTTSLSAQTGFAGANGNISANPKFVNASSDFELQAGSPAVGAGTHTGAPAIDLDCLFRASRPSIGAYEGDGPNVCNNSAGAPPLLAAVLPGSRSAQVNETVTAFATIINNGTAAAAGCSIYPMTNLFGSFVYQTTDPRTNAVTGSPNTAVNIPGNASQSFVIALTPSATNAPTNVEFNFGCTNTSPAPIQTGLNTLLFSASTTPTPDVIALGATLQNDGIVHVTGAGNSGVFAVATSNLGSSDTIKVAANTGNATLPLTVTLCQTNPSTGACMQTASASVSTTIGSNATPTFGIFVNASNSVAFDPANNRIFVTFTDSAGAVRGATSVAVETQ